MAYQYDPRNPNNRNSRGNSGITTTNPYAAGSLDAPAVSVPEGNSMFGNQGSGLNRGNHMRNNSTYIGGATSTGRSIYGGGGSQSAWAGSNTGGQQTNTGGQNTGNTGGQNTGNAGGGTASFSGKMLNPDGSWTKEFMDYMRPQANAAQLGIADSHKSKGYFTPQELNNYRMNNEFADPNLFANQRLQNTAQNFYNQANNWYDPQAKAHFQSQYNQMVAANPNVDLSPEAMQEITAQQTNQAYNMFTDPQSAIGSKISSNPALAGVNIQGLIDWARTNNVSPTSVQAMLNNTTGGMTTGNRVIPTQFLNQG